MYPLSKRGGAAKSGSVRLEALDAPRWIASIQIVCYHMYEHEPGFSRYATWFAMWTQLFFMLSGFVLSYAEMVKPPKKGQSLSVLQYLRRRLTVIYPAFMFSLVLKIAVHPRNTAFEWKVLPLHVLLLQSWFPICTVEPWGASCAPWLFNGESWFLSVLVLYWLMLRPLAQFFRTKGVCFCYATVCLAWVFCLAFQWAGHQNRLADVIGCKEALCINQIMVAIRAGPIGYAHVFVAGVASARIFILTAMRDAQTLEPPAPDSARLELDAERAPMFLTYGCIIGYVVYVAVVLFLTDIIQPYYYFFHTGGLLPVMFFILIGAAIGRDPLTVWLFRCKPMLVLGRISYMQYLMQHIVFEWVKTAFGWQGHPYVKWGFVPFLLVFSYICQRFVERPYTEYQRMRAEKGIRGCDDDFIDFVDGKCARCKKC